MELPCPYCSRSSAYSDQSANVSSTQYLHLARATINKRLGLQIHTLQVRGAGSWEAGRATSIVW
jgi:hypothetical protein